MNMSEKDLIHMYWKLVGGTLIKEFQVVPPGKDHGYRRIDAVIIPDGETEIKNWRDVDLKSKDIICVQAKTKRLGMYLMGQTVFSSKLLECFEPASIKAVALCTQDDSVLRPLLEAYEGVEVVVID